MREHYAAIVRETDARAERSVEIQFMEPESSPFYGGFRDGNDLVEAKFAIYRITSMLACYLNKDSRWHGSAALLERIRLGLDFVERTQRPNGFFDFNDCNFYSAPDTAFCIKRILPVYCYLKEHRPALPGCEEAAARLERILRRGCDAIIGGGFHTPNHRWAIASLMALCAKFFNEPAYRQTADRYLLEGIDCNDDGEYAERSAGNYNRINNDAMIMLAEATGDERYFEPVIRNLQMMLTYFEPDGSVFTNNSTRQDRGVKVYPTDYYFEYLFMGYRFKIPAFLDAANAIFDCGTARAAGHMDCLIYYMRKPELIDLEHTGAGIPDTYRRFYADSHIVRIRDPQYTCSVIDRCPDFLYFQSGGFTCGLRIGGSFCEHRAFVSQQMQAVSPDGTALTPAAFAASKGPVQIQMHEKKVGWYYLPFQEPQGTTDWWQMDQTKRDKIYGPDMIFDVTVTPVADGIDLTVKTTGIDKAPLRLEFSFDAGCTLETDGFKADGIPGGGMIVQSGTLLACKGRDAIELGPCFGTHSFTAGKFGSMGRHADCFTVYLTDNTCFEHTLHIRACSSRSGW